MPNRLQVVFLLSFATVFTSLVLLSRTIDAKLRAAGYDISELILIGLPKDNVSVDNSPSADVASSFIVQKMADFQQLLALVLAVVTSAFIYFKFANSSTRCFTFFPSCYLILISITIHYHSTRLTALLLLHFISFRTKTRA